MSESRCAGAWSVDGWHVERVHGTASDLLTMAEPSAESRWVRLYSVTRPALVLGSSQKWQTVDRRRAARLGVEVVRRRSGGGAVMLMPGRAVWVDLSVPASDLLTVDDVTRAAFWVGELWSLVVARLTGVDPFVHRGGLQADQWGQLVCFAGVGPGEVLVSGRKVVGISQRRNRHRTRFQTIVRLASAEIPSVDSAELAPRADSVPLTPSVDSVASVALTPSVDSTGSTDSVDSVGSVDSVASVDSAGSVGLAPTASVGVALPTEMLAASEWDELELLSLSASERAYGREVLAQRSCALTAAASNVVEALLAELSKIGSASVVNQT